MASLTFTLSEKLNEEIEKIENLKKEILLFPLPVKTEIRMRWEALVDKIYWSMALIDDPVSKKEIIKILKTTTQKKKSLTEKRVVELNDVFNFIYYEWLASQSPITINTLKKIYELGCKDERPGPAISKSDEKELAKTLAYIQTGSDHPIIKAGIIQIQILDTVPFRYANNRMSRLASYLFLYKHYYDLKQLLVLEEYYRQDIVSFNQAIESATKGNNLTLWLEYFAQGVLSQAQKVLNELKEGISNPTLPVSYFRLNERQKKIMALVAKPNLVITNKKVQEMFGISQITASRDLSKLSSIGLLAAHGKGRGVYYTRI
jgi:DNA-binding transcriptional ArsR family regulator